MAPVAWRDIMRLLCKIRSELQLAHIKLVKTRTNYEPSTLLKHTTERTKRPANGTQTGDRRTSGSDPDFIIIVI